MACSVVCNLLFQMEPPLPLNLTLAILVFAVANEWRRRSVCNYGPSEELVDSSPLASTVNIESRSVQVTFPEKQGGAY